MKTIIKYLLVLSLFFSIKGVAQQPGDYYTIADKTTLKGKKELRREKRIKRHELRHTKREERKAYKKNSVKKYTVRLIKPKRKKVKNKRYVAPEKT